MAQTKVIVVQRKADEKCKITGSTGLAGHLDRNEGKGGMKKN